MIAVQEGYARALVQPAEDCGALAAVRDELEPLCGMIAQNGTFFYNPVTRTEKLEGVLHTALQGKVHPLTLAFLTMLVRERRLKRLPAIWRYFSRLADEKLGRVCVTVRMPFAPDDALLEKLRQGFVRRGLFAADQKVTFRIVPDRSLLGGFIAEQGGRMLDASIKSRLAALRRQERQR